MIAVPLIVVSLITGFSDLKDIAILSKPDSRAGGLYFFTTILAVTIGLVLANIVNPGKFINIESRKSTLENFSDNLSNYIRSSGYSRSRLSFDF
jgi:Na+/H+-dicarboxylate symporter